MCVGLWGMHSTVQRTWYHALNAPNIYTIYHVYMTIYPVTTLFLLLILQKFQKRFFVLDKSSLRYYQTPYVSKDVHHSSLSHYWLLTLLQDPFPLGEIILGPSVGGYWVDEEVPEKLQHYTNIFMLHTPARSKGGFPLLAEDATSKAAWIAALQEAFTHSKHMRVLEAGTSASTSAQCREELSYEEEENISTNVTAVF